MGTDKGACLGRYIIIFFVGIRQRHFPSESRRFFTDTSFLAQVLDSFLAQVLDSCSTHA